MHHEYSWCIMSTHDASWILMVHHEYSWCIMSTHDASWHEASWVRMMHHECPWCIRFVTKWHAMEVERILTRQISSIFRHASLRNLRFVRFLLFASWIYFFSNFIWEDPGGPREHPGTTEDLQGPSWRQSVMKWLFQKSTNDEKSTFEGFPWPNSAKFDAESMPGHFPAIGLPKKHDFHVKQNSKSLRAPVSCSRVCGRHPKAICNSCLSQASESTSIW